MEVQSKYELRDMIDELTNQILHLQRSNEELQIALLEEPGEEEFTTAIHENVAVIDSKRTKVMDAKLLLCSIDPAFYNEHYNDEAQLLEGQHRVIPLPPPVAAARPVPVPVLVTVSDVVDEIRTEAGKSSSEGLYL